jgi:hypothetical protein
MATELDSFLKLYESSPTLVLFEGLASTNYSKQKEIVSQISKVASKEGLNPIDVVLESIVNVVSEDVSREELTHSRDKVLINSKIRDLAVERVIKFVNDDINVLKMLHESWLGMLKDFIRQLLNSKKDLGIEEVIYLVGSRFRISSLSAIRAIASIR